MLDGPMQSPPELDLGQARTALRKGISVAVGGVVLIVVATALFSQTAVGEEAVWEVLGRARPGRLVLAWLIMTSAFVFMAFRWRSLMPAGHRPPVPGLTSILLAGLLLNYAVPGPVGEVGAAWFAHKRYGLPMGASLASGMTARAVGLATAAFLAGVLWWVTDLPVAPEHELLIGVASGVIGLGGVALGALAAVPARWQRLLQRVLGPWVGDGLLGRGVGRLLSALMALTQSFADVVRGGLRGPLAAAGWSLVGHTAVIVSILVAVDGLGTVASVPGMAFTYALTTAGAVALFALPGSQVGWDAMFVALLVGTTGLELADAVAIALLVRAQQLSVMALGAVAVAWLLQGLGRGPGVPEAS